MPASCPIRPVSSIEDRRRVQDAVAAMAISKESSTACAKRKATRRRAVPSAPVATFRCRTDERTRLRVIGRRLAPYAIGRACRDDRHDATSDAVTSFWRWTPGPWKFLYGPAGGGNNTRAGEPVCPPIAVLDRDVLHPLAIWCYSTGSAGAFPRGQIKRRHGTWTARGTVASRLGWDVRRQRPGLYAVAATPCV